MIGAVLRAVFHHHWPTQPASSIGDTIEALVYKAEVQSTSPPICSQRYILPDFSSIGNKINNPMESHLPDTQETDRAISLTAGSTQSNGKLAGTSGAPVEPTTGSLASSDRSFDAEGDAQNPPSTASNKRSFTMWEIYLQRQSNMVIPLIRIPGIMKSPQPIETLIQLITDLHKKDVAGVPNGHSSKLELFDDLATNLDSLSKINPKLSSVVDPRQRSSQAEEAHDFGGIAGRTEQAI
ncbi:hypothetical protein BDV93DRAFT_547401 [Ceratobasidium sp. AG-I]|nr:hypothetical protein BDV93DRAFT_547401 [Ceratobasidium sp. AG-I]